MSNEWMFMGAFVLLLITIIAVVVLWRGMEVASTQLGADSRADYKKLAETCTAYREQASTEQAKTRKAVEEIRDRLGSVEKLLREVG